MSADNEVYIGKFPVTCTLLIWVVMPEETQLYLIPDDVVEPYRSFMEEATGDYMEYGKEPSDGLQFLNAALAPNNDETRSYYNGELERFKQYVGLFLKYKLPANNYWSNKDTKDSISTVYQSGFFL